MRGLWGNLGSRRRVAPGRLTCVGTWEPGLVGDEGRDTWASPHGREVLPPPPAVPVPAEPGSFCARLSLCPAAAQPCTGFPASGWASGALESSRRGHSLSPRLSCAVHSAVQHRRPAVTVTCGPGSCGPSPPLGFTCHPHASSRKVPSSMRPGQESASWASSRTGRRPVDLSGLGVAVVLAPGWEGVTGP